MKDKSGDSSVGERIAAGAFLGVVDQVTAKVGTTLIFVILVRLLPESQIATLAVASGYLVLIGYFDMSLARILLRDYSSFAADVHERDTRFTAYGLFWLMQALAIVLTCLLLQYLVFPRFGLAGLNLVFWALAADFLALSLQDWIKTAFYADLQQRIAVSVSAVLNGARLAAVVFVFITPSLDTYAYVLLAMAGLSTFTWIWLFQRRFRSRPRMSGGLLHIIWQSISKFTLWDHVNRLCVDTLFGIDTAVLALLGRMEDLASYSIAMRLTSLMMLVPRQMMNGLQLVLSRHRAPGTRSLFAGSYLKVNLLLCLLQFAALVVLAPWLIRVLFGTGIDTGSVTRFSLVIGLALTILGIGLPLMGVVGALGSVRDATVRVFIPSLVLGIVAYGVVGAWEGAIGMAWAKLFAFSLLSAALILVVRGEQLVQPPRSWVSPIERRWLGQLMNRFRR